jgi:RES domain-containing protein
VLPSVSEIRRDSTHRLIPAKYTDRDESVLTRLANDVNDLNDLFELEGATNDRLLGEAGLLPGISVHELVFGVPYSHIVNAAFTHPRPFGSRFNGPERGAWYAAFARETSEMEVAWHRSRELLEINWMEKETFEYVDFLADFRAEFHDVRSDRRYRDCLNPDSYRASQRLAGRLLENGSAGVIYPSVRHRGGTCIACFRPALVTNVKKGAGVSVTFENAHGTPKIRQHRL